MTTAEKVRNLIPHGLSQRAFAKSVGIHHVTLSKCLKNDSFSLKALKKIAMTYGVSVSSLMPDRRVRKAPSAPVINGYIEYEGKIEAVRSVEDLERILLAVKNSPCSNDNPEKITRKGQEDIPQQLSAKSLDLKSKLDALIEQEHKNTEALKVHPLYYPVPTKKDLFNSDQLKYDASKYVCVAFRSKPDYWKDNPVPLGNMNGGYDYEIGGVKVRTSEHAYILGVFSNNSERHLAIQKKVMAEPSGYQAKHNIRMKNRLYSRLDWRSFKLDWMLYCVWEKIKQCKEFREILLALPEGATIIEDNSFKNKPDKYWGSYNPDRKPFANLARKYARSLDLPTKTAKKKVSDKLIWDFCNYGVFEGTNEMGRILTYLKDCLHKGKEPDINYDLLNKMELYLLGNKLRFVADNRPAKTLKGLILDFDMTLFDTSVDSPYRKESRPKTEEDWALIYSLIPQYRLYDGWREVFDWARNNGIKVGIISTAKKELIERTLKHFNIQCDAVIGWQRLWKKPHKHLVEMALSRMGVKEDEVLSIGNAPVDEEMSRNAGIRFAGALWGCPTPEGLEQTGAVILSSPKEILEYSL